MKALVYTEPETLVFTDAPDPVPASGDVLIRVESVGICGSDMHAFLGHDARRPAPLILGHEVSGTIVAGHGEGRRVSVNPLVTCGTCDACRNGRDNLCPDRQIISMPPREGGFAEYLAIPAVNVVEVPDDAASETAALAEPLACGWHAVRLARTLPGGDADTAKALVIGGGAIGLGAALSLGAQGVTDITMVEPNVLRRQFLQRVCGQRVVQPDALRSDADQFDIVIDGVGIAATRAQATSQVKPGGVIVHIGLGSAEGGLDVRRMTLQEITLIGTYTYTAEDFRATAQAIFDGRLGALDWIETRPLSEGASAFDDIRAGRVAAPKIILRPL